MLDGPGRGPSCCGGVREEGTVARRMASRRVEAGLQWAEGERCLCRHCCWMVEFDVDRWGWCCGSIEGRLGCRDSTMEIQLPTLLVIPSVSSVNVYRFYSHINDN